MKYKYYLRDTKSPRKLEKEKKQGMTEARYDRRGAGHVEE
jgi:hypothetical protein